MNTSESNNTLTQEALFNKNEIVMCYDYENLIHGLIVKVEQDNIDIMWSDETAPISYDTGAVVAFKQLFQRVLEDKEGSYKYDTSEEE